MFGYKLQMPQEIPKIVWACKTKVDQYQWQNRNRANMIEFSICKAPKRTVVWMDQPPEIIEGSTVSCMLGDERRESYAEDRITVEIFSIAVSFDSLCYTPKELEVDDIADKQAILLPRNLKDMPEETLILLENLFYRVIKLNKEHCVSADMLCVSTVLRIMFELDQIARQGAPNKHNKYIYYYVNKVESILLHRYAERLTVKSIAGELSISPNYLSAIFKTSMGVGFADHLLEIRMKKAALLLTEERLPEAEVACLVGYEDLGHFRRRFKQYFGISIRDYCCIHKGFTLYHDPPQKQSEP